MVGKLFAVFGLTCALIGCKSEGSGGAGSSTAAAKTSASGDKSSSASTSASATKPEEAKDAKKDDEKDDEKDDAAEGEGEGEGEFGVKACDDYVKQVGECKTFKKETPAYQGIMKKWKELKDAGKTEDLEKACTKAAELFKCQAK